MEPNTDLGTRPLSIADALKARQFKPITINTTGEKERRNLIIKDIENLIKYDSKGGKYPLWRQFTFPVRIPTPWLEEWHQALIVFEGNEFKKEKELKRLIAESKKHGN